MDTTRELQMPGGSEVGTSLTLPERLMVRTKSSVREGVLRRLGSARTSMRTNPMLWTGLATGAGFALGLLGRIAQWRHKQHGRMPDLVIIETGR